MSVCHYVHRGIMHPEEGRFHMGSNPPHTHTQTVNGRAHTDIVQTVNGRACKVDIVQECILVPKIITDVIQAEWSVS